MGARLGDWARLFFALGREIRARRPISGGSDNSE